MTSYTVARLEEIEELTDGREPFRPVRHHFGISRWVARRAGRTSPRTAVADKPQTTSAATGLSSRPTRSISITTRSPSRSSTCGSRR